MHALLYITALLFMFQFFNLFVILVLLGRTDTWSNHKIEICDSLLKTALFLAVLYNEGFVTSHVSINEHVTKLEAWSIQRKEKKEGFDFYFFFNLNSILKCSCKLWGTISRHKHSNIALNTWEINSLLQSWTYLNKVDKRDNCVYFLWWMKICSHVIVKCSLTVDK